jgi:hypothetical protein
MKLDLDDLERKAHAATPDEWQWRPANDEILEGKHAGQLVLAGEELICAVADRAHIAANSPPVTLALIAYIRKLEGAAHEVVDESSALAGSVHPRVRSSVANLRALLDKGAVVP